MRQSLAWSAAVIAVAFLAGCGEKKLPVGAITWEQCLRELVSMDELPLLDGRAIAMYSSFDRSGGNNDFNNFPARGTEPGWVTLVDLKGPGCIRRIWMTGMDPGHPIRVFIDGEKKPRIDTTLDELFGKAAPWNRPVAQFINMCYYSYVPLPYQQSIRIETREPNTHPFWGPRRIFYQISDEHFPAGTVVESYPRRFTPAMLRAAEEVARGWTAAIDGRAVSIPDTVSGTEIAPGAEGDIHVAEGAGTIKEWRIRVQPLDASGWSVADRERLLQDAVLRVRYSGQAHPSLEAPLGDFFGNAWRKRAYGALWFASDEGGFACRLPMPFTNGVRFSLLNGADRPIQVRFHAERVADRPALAGFLHAEYRRSGPDGAQNHCVASAQGRGKYLGCFLGVTGLDDSWWILEGDERIWADDRQRPAWHGTGLEDYFNGSWYYRGCTYGALNANYDRSPFRVAQFRHQHPDPVSFTNFLYMEFERMTDQQTRAPVKGVFQSVAYYYLAAPTPVQAVPADRAARRAVADPKHAATLMLQLVELERANDLHGALRLVGEHLESQPTAEEAGVYRLRQLEYRRLLGESLGEGELAPFLAGTHGEPAKQQAETLQWFYGATNRALVGFYVNGRGRLALNGQPILSGDHPFHMYVARAELTNGVQRLAAQIEFQREEPWLQMGVRTHGGLYGSGPATWCSRAVQGAWQISDPAGEAWSRVERGVLRGVPDAPYVGGVPNAFVLLQAKSYPVRGHDWGYHRGTYYFREDFSLPLPQALPAHARGLTGLGE